MAVLEQPTSGFGLNSRGLDISLMRSYTVEYHLFTHANINENNITMTGDRGTMQHVLKVIVKWCHLFCAMTTFAPYNF